MGYAIYIDQTGDADVFERRDRNLPPPDAGQIQVRQTAIGLNFIDIYQRRGLYPIALPAILGCEAAGVVEAVGGGVDGFKPGDRVVYLGTGGAYADAANVAAVLAAPIPDGISEDLAASSFLKGLTAEMLLRQVYPLKESDSCLIYAAAGGVGTLLCQWASHIGAHVIGVVGSEAKVSIAKAGGADDVIVRSQTDSIAKEVRALTSGLGVNVVYDGVGEATFEASLDSLAARGHMVTYGNASGPVPPVSPLALSTRGSLTLTRPMLFHYATPDRLGPMAAAVFDLLAKGVLKPQISETFQLDKIANAHRRLESGDTTGAIILKP